jgi:hypothetical protein
MLTLRKPDEQCRESMSGTFVSRSRAASLRSGRWVVPFLVLIVPAPLAARQSARLVVGPNVLVSRDHDGAHVELMLAAHPRDRRNLVGGAITMTRPDGGFATRTYATRDGAHTWHVAQFPEQVQWGGADPQVAFTPHGTALFVTLAMVRDELGRTRGGMHAYRSEDGGVTWGSATDLHYSWDHPQLGVDHTKGRFAGRAYIGVLYGYPVYRVGVFRSDDDGRTWIGPVEAANGAGVLGINVVNLGVFSDGTLFVPYVDFEFLPERRAAEAYEQSMWFVTSSDGALTFSTPRRIGTVHGRRSRVRFGGFPQFAVDGRFDRVYAVWSDQASDRSRLWVRVSPDRGQTWSEPRLIDPKVPADADQYQPAIAVNDSGVVAVSWFDTRGQGDGRSYRQFITASQDGGKTWLEATAVSERAGDPHGDGNVRYQVSGWRPQPDSLRVSLISAASRWGNGGDYMGIAADASGAFHPWWADARSGTFQIMTAEVRLVPGAAAALAPPANLTEQDVTRAIEVLSDPTRFENGVATLPIRLRNIGTAPIYGPLRLTIRGFGSGMSDELQELAPEVLNAANRQTGKGAVFDFSDVMGSHGVLEPGATTGAVEFQLRVKDPLRVPDFHVAVSGRRGTP